MNLTAEPWINVGILSGTKINFELYGEFRSFGFRQTFSGPFTAEMSGDRIICRGSGDSIEVSDEIIFEPSDPSSESFVIKAVKIGVNFHWEREEKQRFNYVLKLLKNNNEIFVINYLPLENYLVSVISSEMNAKSSLQLLKCLAVVARSWVLYQINKPGKNKKVTGMISEEDQIIKWYDREDHKLFDVCADDHCQRFQGISKVTTEKARLAIEQTFGIVLTNRGDICDARFSKACGGITEAFKNVWQPDDPEYLQPVIDYKYEPENFNTDLRIEMNAVKWIRGTPPAYCNTDNPKILTQILLDYDQETKDFFRWKVEYSQDELSEIIRTKSGIDFGKIKDLLPLERGFSGRIIRLKIIGTKKTMIVGKELEIRRWLSHTHLYSSAFFTERFYIRHEIPGKFVIHGAGWGHGVGLCQIGAAVMADKGHLFDEILMHYYKNSSLKKIY